MRWSVVFAACCAASSAGLAQAASTFTCTPTNNSILFGTYNPLGGSPLDGTGTFVIACTDVGGKGNQATTLNYSATLSGQALRQLAPPTGTDRVNYNLYTDSARATIWGNGTAGTGTITGSVSVPPSSTVTTLPITYYGRITAAQDVSANSPGPAPTTYSQTLTITVTCTNSKNQAVSC